MANPSYNKRKGAAFEIDVMKWFRKMGVIAERLRLSGKEDEGEGAAAWHTEGARSRHQHILEVAAAMLHQRCIGCA